MINRKPIIIVTLSLISLLVAANIVVSASYSTTGETLKALETKKADLLEANRDLNQQLLSQSSLTHLQQRAQELGFVRPDKIITLNNSSRSVALSRP